MNSSLLKNILLIVRVILPAILCFLFNYLGDGYNHFEIIIIPFAVLIVLFNKVKVKYKFIATLILSLILSFISFNASILLFLGLGYPTEFLLNQVNSKEVVNEFIYKIIAILSYSVLPLILIFYWHSRLFKVSKTNYRKYIKYIAFLLTSIFIFFSFESDDKNKGSFVISIWQFIVALALQLILYQEELKAILLKKTCNNEA